MCRWRWKGASRERLTKRWRWNRLYPSKISVKTLSCLNSQRIRNRSKVPILTNLDCTLLTGITHQAIMALPIISWTPLLPFLSLSTPTSTRTSTTTIVTGSPTSATQLLLPRKTPEKHNYLLTLYCPIQSHIIKNQALLKYILLKLRRPVKKDWPLLALDSPLPLLLP